MRVILLQKEKHFVERLYLINLICKRTYIKESDKLQLLTLISIY